MRFLNSPRGRGIVNDALIIALLFALPLLLFFPQTLGGRTLIPADNLYQYPPYAADRESVGVPAVPHNHLISDLILQNVQWKSFIRESLSQGEIPLWNPHQFSGIAFMAAGQQSTLYPFSILYYVMPLWLAYGWFTVIQLGLAGVFMFAFVRGLGVGRFGSTVAGVTYQLSAFFVISAVFPMIIASAVWLPLILLMIEYIVVKKPRGTPLWIAIGAFALGCNILAGHVEITYYTLIISGFYAAARLITLLLTHTDDLTPVSLREPPPPRIRGGESETRFAGERFALRSLALLLMVALGIGIGAVQFIPLFEAASNNFRSSGTTLDQVLDWAHPFRDLIQFVLPNFYGNPSHHTIYNVFTGEPVTLTVNALGEARTHTEWGIKNYVEGALYVGILPLALAIFALFTGRVWHGRNKFRNPLQGDDVGAHRDAPVKGEVKTHRGIKTTFAILAAFSLTVMFGLPTYAILYYTLPGIDQLHSPFRWVFGLTLSVAALAGFGADTLNPTPVPSPNSGRGEKQRAKSLPTIVGRDLGRGLAWLLIITGALTLIGAVGSYLLYDQITAGIVERVFNNMALATSGFPDARLFYSYQAVNLAIFGVVTLASGIAVWWLRRSSVGTRLALSAQAAQIFMVIVIAADLMIASGSFNAAADPAWLDHTPASIEWLQSQEGEWRYITLDDPTIAPAQIFNANMTTRDQLDDVRGYESIIPRGYVDYMREIAPQTQLDFNRVAPIYTAYPEGIDFDFREALTSPRLDDLNVRYVITQPNTDISDVEGYTLAYEDASVRIWENTDYRDRAFMLGTLTDDESVSITALNVREYAINARADQSREIVFSMSYDAGWRAYAFPTDGRTIEEGEIPLEIQVHDGGLMRVTIPPGSWMVRFVYSPQSFFLGAVISFVAGVIGVLLVAWWGWRTLTRRPNSDSSTEASSARTIAKNSLTPIILNLFNRGIDMAFALIMLRILGPADAGLYFYAGVVFVWFDIFTNFGLNVYLTREVSRDRSRAAYFLRHTSALRLILIGVGIFLLIAFLAVRQSAADALPMYAVITIAILYVGLLPNTLSNGLSALYYAFERAEIPAMVATLATILKTIGGLAVLILIGAGDGRGIIGLAAVSIVVNVVTLIALWLNSPLRTLPTSPRRNGISPPLPMERGAGDKVNAVNPSLLRRMVNESYPLMFNHFLATIFFQVDVILIEWLHNPTMVGQYSVGYKWLAALNVIPAFFTQALLPIMSRQAHGEQADRAALKRNVTMGLKLLASVALPTAVFFTFTAYALAGLLGGAEYLPEGAIATQLMIWSIPIGWMNSLTQYVLIALDLQRRITRAFVLGVGFNIIANLIFIPSYGYQAAAITTIFSELVLMIAFSWLLRESLGAINWLEIFAKPMIAAGAMAAVMFALYPIMPVLAVIVGSGVYLVVWVALRTLNAEERARLAPLLPARLRARVV